MKINIKKILWTEINHPIWGRLIAYGSVVIIFLIFGCLADLSSKPIITTTDPIYLSASQIESLQKEEQVEEDFDVDCSYEETFYTPVTHISNLKWFTARIKEHNKHAYIDIEYPQFIGGEEVEKLNAYIKGVVSSVLYIDRNDVKEWIANKEKWCEDAYEGTLWSCSVQLVSEYKVSSIINDIISLELVITDFTGGGNGNHDVPHVINWDLKNNKSLDDKGIFCHEEYQRKLRSAVYLYILDKYSSSIDERYHLDEKHLYYIQGEISESIKSSDFGILLGYRGLSIVFRPYVILSGAEGILRIPIPYSDLEDRVCF